MNQKQHVSTNINKKSNQQREDYHIRLKGSISARRFLLQQGLSFRGHDESNSMNRGSFLELLHYTTEQNEEYGVNKLISDLGDVFFSILVDEAHDGSNKEQMTIILRYVNKRGCVVECLLSIMHITDMTALSLKMGIETLFSKYNLSISRLRGQGYDGASNMRGQRRDLLNEKQALKVKKAIESGELSTGQGLNQDTSLKRPGETRWGSHYGTLLSLINLFSSVIEVLEDLTENSDNRVEANMPNMQEKFVARGRSRRNVQEMTNLFHYCVELFYAIIDLQLSELKSRFNEASYLLITLALTLPVATASVERAFSAMKIVKIHLRNRMGD
ncbi:uncharacterized protein LOC116124058 [Pistacia vera]|uniref:uncharacterized protein LOC116124058 n=1 Tax=Pistacia vera TaxID=55513 RepID=UPI0012633859|nr:uncharacterized protein LOC116124058 [Pistacia vera]